MNRSKLTGLIITLTISVLIIILPACAGSQEETPVEEVIPSNTPGVTAMPEVDTSPTQEVITPIPTETMQGSAAAESGENALRFAAYQPLQVEAVPSLSQPAISPDLSNVQIPFVLSESQLARLAEDGFVVSPGDEKEFFTVYEKARYNNQPIFVTSDALLHVYHLMFDKILRSSEVEYFIPLLNEMNHALLDSLDQTYAALAGTEWEDAAKRAVAFVGVGTRLLDPQAEVPEYARELVEAELANIDAASGFIPSPIFPGLDYGEDYTQYIPRGHYTRSEDLQRYFRSMMWYGRMTFRLKTDDPNVGREETKAALLLVHALNNTQLAGRTAWQAWKDLYEPTVFFVGRSDDLLPEQYLNIIGEIYGPEFGLEMLLDNQKLDQFIEEAYQLQGPRILGIVIMDTDDVEQTTKGMRFMGQRFVPDAYIFRELIYRNVGTPDHRRGLPMGLDIPAAMGSERAYQILDGLGQTGYANYPEQMGKMRAWTASLTEEQWTETLYNGWLYSFYPLLETTGGGYPLFMQSQSWLDKQLNTVLGSWAELKHDTILYAKQVYAELGGGPPPPPPVPPKGYVEPVPEFFARLAALTAMTQEGLQQRGLLSESDSANLERLESLSISLAQIAEGELQGVPLSEEQEELIRYIGGELEHLTMASADSDVEDPFAPRYMEEEPQAAVIADVATDPDNEAGHVVLEEGVGRINTIYVVVPVIADDGQTYLQVNKGAVFSYYEFPWPADDRLTDEKWREMLENDSAPSVPTWTSSFMVNEGEYQFLTTGVSDFQNLLTQIYWEPGSYEYYNSPAIGDFRQEIESLASDYMFVSHQLLSSNFRSFDLQSDDLAVVTVREVWQDQMFEGEWPDYNLPIQAQRGPYTMDAVYTLQPGDYGWQVTNVVYQGEFPDWE